MSGNTYGKLFTVTTAGESHGPALVAIVGYKLIHTVGRISTVIGILGFGYLAWQLCHQYDVAMAFGQKPFTWASFLTAMALSAGCFLIKSSTI